MTTDYDRISADDLTQQTEEQLDQTEGGQTTGPVKTARKKATSSAKPASAKRTSKKRSQKTPAGQGAADNTDPHQSLVTVEIGAHGAWLNEIAQAIADHHPSDEAGDKVAASRLVDMTVNTDNKIFLLSNTAAFQLTDGDSGNDHLYGGAGDDVLNGVDGENFLTGGAGADRFVLNRNGTGTTTVTDFEDGTDKIQIYTSNTEAKSSLSDLGLAVSAYNVSAAQITHSSDTSENYMILNNVTASHISFADFEIV